MDQLRKQATRFGAKVENAFIDRVDFSGETKLLFSGDKNLLPDRALTPRNGPNAGETKLRGAPQRVRYRRAPANLAAFENPQIPDNAICILLPRILYLLEWARPRYL